MNEKWIEVSYRHHGSDGRFIVKVSDIEFIKDQDGGVIKSPNGDSQIGRDEYIRLRGLLVDPEFFAPEVVESPMPGPSPYFTDEEEIDLDCNMCPSGKMLYSVIGRTHSFRCPECIQRATYDGKFSGHTTGWDLNTGRTDEICLSKGLPMWYRDMVFFAKIMLIAGDYDMEDYTRQISTCRNRLVEKYEELGKKWWWQFWKPDTRPYIRNFNASLETPS
jgi:hypothetical protein